MIALTFISSDFTDLEPLTPADLLYVEHNTDEDELNPGYGDEFAIIRKARVQALMPKNVWGTQITVLNNSKRVSQNNWLTSRGYSFVIG